MNYRTICPKAFLLAALVLGVVFSFGSCRANLIANLHGSARLSVALSGVLGAQNNTAHGAGQVARGAGRVVSAATASVRVTVTDSGGTTTTSTQNIAFGTNSISVSNLPDGVPLSVGVVAMDSVGALISSWSGTATLSKGDNTLSAVLEPEASSVSALGSATIPASGSVDLQASLALSPGSTVFYTLPVSVATEGDYQIIYDTGSARWAWLGAYGDDWSPINVCTDSGEGWAVVHLTPSTTSVKLALSNALSSPGYPSGSLTGKLQVRRARFFAPGASGDGSYSSPNSSFALLASGESGFLSAGTFSLAAPLELTGDQRLYGGFASDWKSRTATTELFATYQTTSTELDIAAMPNDIATVAFTGSGSGVLDDLLVTGQNLTTQFMSSAVLISTTGKVVFNRCTLRGNQTSNDTGVEAGSVAMFHVLGEIEFASSVMDAGTGYTTATESATCVGFYCYAGTTAIKAYLHQSDIYGGYANATQDDAVTAAVAVFGDVDCRIAGCRISAGKAMANAASGDSECYGVFTQIASTGRLDVVSSAVSGGHNEGFGAVGSAVLLAGAGTQNILGCVLDSGYTQSATTGSISSAVTSTASSANVGTVAGCVLSCSTIPSTNVYAAPLVETGSTYGFAALYGNAIIGTTAGQELFQNGSYVAHSSSRAGGSISDNIVSGRDLAQELASYHAPSDFTDFLELNWRAASGAACTGTSSNGGPSSWGLDSAAFTDYPAEALDLAANARTYSATWKRGAY